MSERPFQKIPEACRTTGLSQYYLRKGCKDGSIPCTLWRGVLHKHSGPASKIGGDGIDERGQKKSPSQCSSTGTGGAGILLGGRHSHYKEYHPERKGSMVDCGIFAAWQRKRAAIAPPYGNDRPGWAGDQKGD